MNFQTHDNESIKPKPLFLVALFIILYSLTNTTLLLSQIRLPSDKIVEKGLKVTDNVVYNKDGKVLISSTHGIIQIYSDSISDLFFIQHQRSTANYNETEGEIWEIKKDSVFKRLNSQTYIINTSYSIHTTADFFSCGFLVSKRKDKTYEVRNFKLDLLYKDLIINDFIDVDTLFPIIYSNESEKYLLNGNKKIPLYDYWKSSEFNTFPYIINNLNKKRGAILFTHTYDISPKYRMTVLLPEFDDIDINNFSVELLKEDTLWQFREDQFKPDFQYNKNFELAYKLKHNGSLKEIGSKGIFTSKKFLDKDFYIPNTPYAGIIYKGFNYNNQSSADSGYFYSTGLELGVGNYYSESELEYWYGSWEYAGWGVGLEYNFPARPRKEILNQSGEKFRSTYLNIRAEGGAGLYIIFIPISIHGQLGYSTNFYDHYLNAGLGFSFVNVQIGYCSYLPLNNLKSGIKEIQGIYIRFHAFE